MGDKTGERDGKGEEKQTLKWREGFQREVKERERNMKE